jgi:hypothetical protein
MDKVYCEDCENYRRDHTISTNMKFVNGFPATLYGDHEMCQHPVCFKREMNKSFVTKNPPCYKIRIQGQYQLNKNRNCQYFEKIKTIGDYIKTLINKFRNSFDRSSNWQDAGP